MSALATVGQALDALRAGRPVLVVDDADRENEGDVVLAAELATAEWVGWTVRHTSGYLCAPMPGALADRLALPAMVPQNEDELGTAYTVSVDARQGVTTGISAADRARTVRVLADPATTPRDLVRPGHVLPLRAREGGVLERPGHTEATVDLCRLAGLTPVGLIGEVVRDDGSMARLPELLALGAEHDLPVLTIADLVAFRLEHDPEPLREADAARRPDRVRREATSVLPTRHGPLTVHGYRDLSTGAEHVALVGGDLAGPRAVVRLHSECLTGDALGSLRCDCGAQLDAALALVAERGGVVVYLRGHEGRGIGLLPKLAAYALQDAGRDTVEANLDLGLPADARDYEAGAAVLADLGLTGVRLVTNNPDKVAALESAGIVVHERVSLHVGRSAHNTAYLETKRRRFGHDLPAQESA